MLRLLLGAPRGRSDCARAVCDPLTPVIDVLDRAHGELKSQDLAAVLVEVDRLASVLGAHGIGSARANRWVVASYPEPSTPEGQAYLRSAASTLCECIGGPLVQAERDHLGARLEAYIEEVAARPAGCAVPA
jgi:hypothetical protein